MVDMATFVGAVALGGTINEQSLSGRRHTDKSQRDPALVTVRHSDCWIACEPDSTIHGSSDGHPYSVCQEIGDIVIVADARLDQVDLLRQQVGHGEAGATGAESLTALLATAYRRWGQELPAHITGDFSFVIVDGTTHTVMAARDPFGMRELFYWFAGGQLLFSNRLSLLLEQLGARARINRDALGRYLVSNDPASTLTATFYQDVLRVIPGHVYVFTGGGQVHHRPYWSPGRTGRNEQMGSFGEAADRFRALLFESVRHRITSTGPVALAVSGGLDSTSVACAIDHWAKQGLAVDWEMFSFRYGDDHSVDETPYTNMIAEHIGKPVHYVDVNGLGPLDFLALSLGYDDEPPQYWNDMGYLRLMQAAQALGRRTLLHGQAADSLFTVESVIFALYWRQWRYDKILRTLRSVRPHRRRLVLQELGRQISRELVPLSLRERTMMRRYGASHQWLAEEVWAPIVGQRSPYRHGIPGDDSDLIHAVQTYLTSTWYYPIGTELRQIAHSCGLTVADPYLTRELVEFSMELPVDFLWDTKQRKPLLRQAMQGYLPEQIRTRQTKTLFSRALIDGLRPALDQEKVALADWILVESGYILPIEFRSLIDQFIADPTSLPSSFVLRPVLLEYWVRRHSQFL